MRSILRITVLVIIYVVWVTILTLITSCGSITQPLLTPVTHSQNPPSWNGQWSFTLAPTGIGVFTVANGTITGTVLNAQGCNISGTYTDGASIQMTFSGTCLSTTGQSSFIVVGAHGQIKSYLASQYGFGEAVSQ